MPKLISYIVYEWDVMFLFPGENLVSEQAYEMEAQ